MDIVSVHSYILKPYISQAYKLNNVKDEFEPIKECQQSSTNYDKHYNQNSKYLINIIV